MERAGLKVDDLVICLRSQNHQAFPSRRIHPVNARNVFLHELNRLLAGQPLNASTSCVAWFPWQPRLSATRSRVHQPRQSGHFLESERRDGSFHNPLPAPTSACRKVYSPPLSAVGSKNSHFSFSLWCEKTCRKLHWTLTKYCNTSLLERQDLTLLLYEDCLPLTNG